MEKHKLAGIGAVARYRYCCLAVVPGYVQDYLAGRKNAGTTRKLLLYGVTRTKDKRVSASTDERERGREGDKIEGKPQRQQRET